MGISLLQIVLLSILAFGAFFVFLIYRSNDPSKLKSEAKDLSYEIQLINNELENQALEISKRDKLEELKEEKQQQLNQVLFLLRNNESNWSHIDESVETTAPNTKPLEKKSLGALMNEMSQEISHMYVPQDNIEYTPSGHLYISCTDQAVINNNLLVEERERVIVALCKKQLSVERALKDPSCKDKVKMMELLHTYQIRINEQVNQLKECTHADHVEINMNAKCDDNVIHYNFASK